MKSGTGEKAEVHRDSWITASKAKPATCVGRVKHAGKTRYDAIRKKFTPQDTGNLCYTFIATQLFY